MYCTPPRPGPGLPCSSQQQPVQVTVEKELDGSLAFVDVKITSSENQYLSFDFNHPLAHKVALVRTLMTRPDAFSSSGVNWAQEEKEVAAVLKENGYQGRPRPPTDGQCPKKFLTIPDIGGLLENIRQFLKSLDFQVIFP